MASVVAWLLRALYLFCLLIAIGSNVIGTVQIGNKASDKSDMIPALN